MNELRQKIAKLGFQYAYLIDDKNVDGAWALTKEQDKWLDMADQILARIKKEGYVKVPPDSAILENVSLLKNLGEENE